MSVFCQFLIAISNSELIKLSFEFLFPSHPPYKIVSQCVLFSNPRSATKIYPTFRVNSEDPKADNGDLAWNSLFSSILDVSRVTCQKRHGNGNEVAAQVD